MATTKAIDLKSIPSVKREGLLEEFKSNHESWKKSGEEMGMSLCEYVNRVSPVPRNEADPENAIHSLMRERGLAMKDSATRDSSLIKECLDDPVNRALLGADLQMTYDNILFRGHAHPLETRAGGVGAIPAGSPFKPFDDAPAKPGTIQGNRVSFRSIVPRVRMVTGTTGRIPELLPPEQGSNRFRLGEFTQIPVNTVSMGVRQFSLSKMGTGLRWSYEFARDNNERVSALRLWIADVAIENEAELTREAILIGMSTIDAADSSDGLAKSNLKYPTSGTGDFDVETMRGLVHALPQRYVINTLVGGHSAVTKWEMIDSGSNNLALAAFASQAPDNQVRFRNANINIQYPENTLVYTESVHPDGVTLDPNSDAHLDVSADQLFFFDSTRLLEMARQRGAQTRETESDAAQQFYSEYFSDYYEIYLYDPNARVKAYL